MVLSLSRITTIAKRYLGRINCVLPTMESVQSNGRQFSTTIGAVSATFRDSRITKCSDYESSIATLNALQTFIGSAKGAHKQSSEILQLMDQWLKCLGYSQSDLERLRAIHVSGTKGKGSTCALTESMLRRHGLKTGLFTSPHLRQACERIRLNGLPLSMEAFASNFWSVYNRLKENSKLPLPGYFHFLTLLAFDVFLKEGVDVAVIEVGIGGEFDSTNVLRKPVVCGVSALGMDHIAILGNTIDKIAWHKAGIFKSGVPAFTQPQPDEAMQVLIERAAKIECPLLVVPPYNSYLSSTDLAAEQLGLDGNIQHANASLALQLVNTWTLARNSHFVTPHCSFTQSDKSAATFRPSAPMIAGLRSCTWPGRYQRIVRSPHTYWVDGAHTVDSIRLCTEWFFANNGSESSVPSVLLFNTTGPRHAEDFLNILMSVSQQNQSFALATFCPTVPRLPPPPDSAYNVASHSDQIARCREMANFWLQATSNSSPAETRPTVDETLALIKERFPNGCRVLVTGSLHLVGSLLEALDEPVV